MEHTFPKESTLPNVYQNLFFLGFYGFFGFYKLVISSELIRDFVWSDLNYSIGNGFA